MRKDPAFLFYTEAFLTGIMFMTNEEVGIYIKLLCIQHQHGGLIDKATFNNITENRPAVKAKFIEEEDGFFNKRLMDEMHKRAVKSSNLSANAKKRWEDMQLHSKSNANAMPTKDKDKDTTKDIDRFNVLWSLYPNKDGRKLAIKHFLSSVSTDKDWEDIQLALKNYLQSDRVKKGYIKNGSTWFNNWRDWVAQIAPTERRMRG